MDAIKKNDDIVFNFSIDKKEFIDILSLFNNIFENIYICLGKKHIKFFNHDVDTQTTLLIKYKYPSLNLILKNTYCVNIKKISQLIKLSIDNTVNLFFIKKGYGIIYSNNDVEFIYLYEKYETTIPTIQFDNINISSFYITKHITTFFIYLKDFDDIHFSIKNDHISFCVQTRIETNLISYKLLKHINLNNKYSINILYLQLLYKIYKSKNIDDSDKLIYLTSDSEMSDITSMKSYIKINDNYEIYSFCKIKSII